MLTLRRGCTRERLLLQNYKAQRHAVFISRQALAREGDYEMMPVCACVRAWVCACVS